MSTRSYDGRPDRDRPDVTVAAGRAPAGEPVGEPVGEPGEPVGEPAGGTDRADASGAGTPDRAEDSGEDSVEARVRDALRGAAAGVRPSQWRPGDVLDRAARRRRARRLAVTLPAVAAVLACACLAAVVQRDAADGVMPAGTPSRPTASTTTTTTAPAPAPSTTTAPTTKPTGNVPPTPTKYSGEWVSVLPVGQAIGTAHGEQIRLEHDHSCVSDDRGEWTCDSVVGPNEPKNTVSVRNAGNVVTPLYIGDGIPSLMTVTVGGHTFPARILIIRGHPGYAAGYVVVPPKLMPGLHAGFGAEVVMVYDSHGTILASMGTPDDLHRPTFLH